MPMRVECPACGATLNVGDSLAGKRVKCPKCQKAVTIPVANAAPESASEPEPEPETYALAGAAPTKVRAVPVRPTETPGAASVAAAKAVAPTRRSQTPRQILAAFQGEIAPVRPTLLYQFWILVVAGLMVLLPILYVALVGLVGTAVVLHAVYDVAIFQKVRNGKAAVLLYLGPLVAGGVVAAFMIKPLFARPAKQPKTRALDPSIEPLVFAFVDGVCSSVGAPRPSRIEVDCDVNASASRAGGALAVFHRDLVLTIGLPLVAGLNLRQLAGVLAHEFGHFSQGAGMRLSYLIRTINVWFARVVYERDSWDESLTAWSTGGHTYTILLVLIARAAVWLTRRVLWVLMIIGHAASGFLLRQMEFDADRYMARMIGATVFTETSRRVRVLGLAAQGAYADLQSSWAERRLPDDLTKLILANIPQIPEPVLQALLQAEVEGRTGLFDTHPADKDRIARARAEATEGIYHGDGPATDLFRDFDALARLATYNHYRALLGPSFTKDQLYPVADALQGQAVAQQGREAFGRYFLGTFGPFQPLPLPASYPAVPADLKAAKSALVAARSDLVPLRDLNIETHKRWDEVHGKAVLAASAVALLKAGAKLKPADFGLPDRTLEAAEAAVRKAGSEFQDLAASWTRFSTIAARRLELALALLESDVVVTRVSDGSARRDEARALYPCTAHLGGRIVSEQIPVLWARHTVIHLAQTITQGKTPNNPDWNNGLLRAVELLHTRVVTFQGKISDSVFYPFEHGQEHITLRRFALPIVPGKESIGDLVNAAGEAIEKISTLYLRVLGRLTVTAEEVERALGLPPLPGPDQDQDHQR
jgi:predicted Zn finger-like uncharacterized protein